MIDILLPAFVVSLVLLGIHSYFGIRIIERNIIFTDLAIGQMAALGAAVSLYFFGGAFIYPISLASALAAGMLIIALSKRSGHLEAVIGLMYAMGISGVFMLLSKYPHGMEEFQNLMAYDILFTRMRDILAAGVLYLCVGAALYFIEHKAKGDVREMLFIAAFAVTVTSSVKIAGVLVVFAILLAPSFIVLHTASCAVAPGLMKRQPLIFAWTIGTVINMAAIVISYYGDLPTGYTIVFCNAVTAVAVSFVGGKKSRGGGE